MDEGQNSYKWADYFQGRLEFYWETHPRFRSPRSGLSRAGGRTYSVYCRFGEVIGNPRHKLHEEIVDPKVGDAYAFVGIERNTKLILAWHLGERGIVDTYFAYYNFSRISFQDPMHSREAMENGLTGHIWTLRELLTA